jgi:hypothetical protein
MGGKASLMGVENLALTGIRSPDRISRGQEYGYNQNSSHSIQQGHEPSRLVKQYILNL